MIRGNITKHIEEARDRVAAMRQKLKVDHSNLNYLQLVPAYDDACFYLDVLETSLGALIEGLND